MKSLFSSIGVILKRPIVFIYMSVIVGVFCIVEYFNPITDIIQSLGKLGGGNIFDNFFTIIYSLVNALAYPKMFLILAALIFVLSILSGLLMSGYLFAVNNTIEKRKRTSHELIQGIKKYFFKMFFLSFFTMIIAVIFLIAVLVSLVPAFYLTQNMLAGNYLIPGYAIILIDLISAFVLFVTVMFFEVYVSFMFPSLYSGEKKPYKFGKAVAKRAFSKMIMPLIVFDVVLVAFQIFLSYFDNKIIVIAVINWIFKSFYVSVFISYIFAEYKRFKEVENQ